MKKIHTVSFIILTLLLSSVTTYAQTASSVQKKIELANRKFVKWFNAGKADSIVSQYHPNACITGKGCGTAFLKSHYAGEIGTYTIKDITTTNVTVDGTRAIERGQWRVMLSNNTVLSGKYESEWQLLNNQWVIFKETMLE